MLQSPAVSVARPLYLPADTSLRFLPEGPYPLQEGCFSWVAIQHGADADHGSLNIFDMRSGKNSSYPLPGRPGFAFPCDDEERSFIVGCERKLGLFRPSDGAWNTLVDGVDKNVTNTIINDGVVFEDNLIFGLKDLEFKTRKAGLYLYRGRDQKLVQLRNDQICSNGKAIVSHAEGLSLIDIDSPTRKIVSYALDIDAGTIGAPTTLIDLTNDPAVPDGMILTPDGNGVIVSMFNPNPADFGETRMYDLTSGDLLRVWQTPGSPQNTCPNLVYFDASVQLIITTAIENMPTSQQKVAPNAGSLFVASTDFESIGKVPKFSLAS